MGYNSDLFLALRDEEINSQVYFNGKSKKEVVLSAEVMAFEMIESGEVDSKDALSKVVKLKDYLDTVEKKLRADLESEMFHGEKHTHHGVTFQYSEGSKRLNYEDDPIYKAIKEMLKSREELLKCAFNSSDMIFDSEGVEVPKVSCSYTKDSVKISY